MPQINTPSGLISNFQTQLEHDWSRFRDLEGDDSARGASYEKAFRDLLNEYLGGRFDFYTNCSVMDENLDCFEEFGDGPNNEVDIVSLFSHSTPRLVLREENMTWVPLEGISFLCEVKSRVDKQRLGSDIDKLSILRELEKDPDERFGPTVSGDCSVNHQIHCLVYDESSISDKSLMSKLEGNTAWDLVLLVKDDILIVNQSLPIQEYLLTTAVASQLPNPQEDERIPTEEGSYPKKIVFPGDSESNALSIDSGLTWFMLALAGSIPWPIGHTTTNHLSQLAMASKTNVQFGASTSITEELDIEEDNEVDSDG